MYIYVCIYECVLVWARGSNPRRCTNQNLAGLAGGSCSDNLGRRVRPIFTGAPPRSTLGRSRAPGVVVKTNWGSFVPFGRRSAKRSREGGCEPDVWFGDPALWRPRRHREVGRRSTSFASPTRGPRRRRAAGPSARAGRGENEMRARRPRRAFGQRPRAQAVVRTL